MRTKLMVAVVTLAVLSAAFGLSSTAQAQGPGFLGIQGRGVGSGVEIVRVVPNTPAEQAGLEVGDVIVSVNGLPISSMTDLYYAKPGPGGFVRLRIRDVRTGYLVYRNVRLL